MSERRISGWFVLSAVFIVAVFGLFFTFTERKTWPEKRVELSATDMRLVPPSSTLWCEAIALYSDHPFVAYQVSQIPVINPKHLNKQKVNLNFKLNGGSGRSSMTLKYYMLPSSVIEIFACATYPGARLLVFKGEKDAPSYLEYLLNEENDSASSDSDSLNDSSEEDSTDSDCVHPKVSHSYMNWRTTKCASLVSNSAISLSEEENVMYSCEGYPSLHPVHVNVTSADFYVIAVFSNSRHRTNSIGLRIVLDRSRYTIHKSGLTFDMCSLSTTCTIGLSFASKDRALVWIPEEPNAGRSTFVIRSQCKPRLAVFAILSVFFPLIVFLGVAFVVRADRERIMRIYRGRSRPSTEREQGRSDTRIAAPLLNDNVVTDLAHFHVLETPQTPTTDTEELPPPYHTLYDPPPPYVCVKEEGGK